MTNDTTPKRSEWLILSDTHGNTDRVRRVLSLCAPVDGILFLGDGEHDMEVLQQQYPALPVVGVRGNCDFFSRLPVACVCTIAGHTLWLTHGHAYGVKGGTARLEAAAFEGGADAVLFGHTHHATEQTVMSPDGRRLILFNPGSLGFPDDGRPRFGRLAADENGLLFSTGTLD